MREIKFRGKRIDNGEWIYGSLYTPNPELDKNPCIIVDEGVQVKPSDVNGPAEYDSEVKFYEVDEKTVGQFIGLHDKNGKEIYEGDILYSKPIELQATVSSLDGGWYPFMNDKTWEFVEKSTYKDREWEVIGNIYENPELLNH